MARRRNKNAERDIARERVARLVQLAEQAILAKKPERAARYAEIAWAVKTTYQLRQTAIDGRRCRGCGAFFGVGTARVRLREGMRITTCLACGAVRRRPLALRAPLPGARDEDADADKAGRGRGTRPRTPTG